MKSPFPGMDPYLERHWPDVHLALIGYIRDALQPQLSDDLIARMEENVYVEDPEDPGREILRPDARVVEFTAPSQFAAGITSAAVVDEPMLLESIGDPIRHRSVLIYDFAGNRIVTAIEVLSPWNKTPGQAVKAYLDKRNKYLNSETNLVEIDLIRIGDWTKMIGPYAVPKRGLTTYRATVNQPELPGPYHYPISINAKLPTIKIPLRQQDQPARLNLQELIDKAYMMGRYDHIDYSKPCTPPLVGPEKEWAAEVVRSAERA